MERREIRKLEMDFEKSFLFYLVDEWKAPPSSSDNESGIQFLESEMHNVGCRIQERLTIPGVTGYQPEEIFLFYRRNVLVRLHHTRVVVTSQDRFASATSLKISH